MRIFAFLFLLVFAGLLTGTNLSAGEMSVADRRGEAVIREMNLARQHPNLYADILETRRSRFRGSVFVQADGSLLRSREGVNALDDAVRFLRRTSPLPPLSTSSGMSEAAAEHVSEQADGGFGHSGSNGSNPATRLSQHGFWSGAWGENISYGKASAREIVAALIIDDGQRARKHRKNIFNPAFHFAGAAVGPHARYRTVCSIDFAGGYTERSATISHSLLARN